MKSNVNREIKKIYELCGLNETVNNHTPNTPNNCFPNNKLNANYDFLYKNKSTPVWTNSSSMQ